MIEVVDKVIAEFRGGKMASEEALYEFHVNHESSEFSPASPFMGPHFHGTEQADAQSCLLCSASSLRLPETIFSQRAKPSV